MFRRLLIAAVLSAASMVATIPVASAQTYGGITLTFSSGGYGDDSDFSPYGPYANYYYYDQQPNYDYYGDIGWAFRQRLEQRERWRQEQARRSSWYENNEQRDDDDEDDD